MYYPGPCWPPYPHPYPYPGPWGGPLLAEATRSAAQPAASIAGMMAAPAVMPSLVDYCPPWPPIPPWWPWPPIPPWPPWRDVFNEMARTRTAAAPESSAPVTPRSREDFPDAGTAAAPVTSTAPVISAQEQQMLKELVKAMKQALADKESSDAKIAGLATAQLKALSMFALGWLEGKGLVSIGSLMIAFQYPTPKHAIVNPFQELTKQLESLSENPTRIAPLIIGALAGALVSEILHHH